MKRKMDKWRWKNTSYFLGLEKKIQTNHTIKELRDENNEMINTYSAIIKEICDFYEIFYRTNPAIAKKSIILMALNAQPLMNNISKYEMMLFQI